MLSPYILIFQFLDAEESRIADLMEPLRRRLLSSDPRRVSGADYDEFYHLKIKLDYLRYLSDRLLTLIKDYGTI